MEKWKYRFKKLIKLIRKPEMGILPGHLAFFLVLSIFPIMLLFVLLANHFSVSTDAITVFINNYLPGETADVVIPFITSTSFSLNISFVLLLMFFIASNGLHSVIIASNTLYQETKPNFIKRRIKSIILTIVLLFLFIFMIVVMAFGDRIMLLVKDAVNADLIYEYLRIFYVLIKWPFAFIYIFIVINLIFTVAPDNKVKSRSAVWGSLFTTVTWIIATYAFSFYAANIAQYNVIYGSLSSIVVTMIWIYILSYLFVIGIAINASRYEKPEELEEIEEEKEVDNE